MKRIQMFMAAAWAAGAALSPSVASAAEYFVAPGGDDAADGSAARPWRTFPVESLADKVGFPHAPTPIDCDKLGLIRIR